MQFKHGNYQHAPNDFFTVTDKGCRTQQQYDSFIKFFSEIDFEFLTGNPFQVNYPGESYNCTFAVYYYASGKINSIQITPTGKIRQQIC